MLTIKMNNRNTLSNFSYIVFAFAIQLVTDKSAIIPV